MTYHIFHTAKEFWNQVKIYKSKGYTWVQENHPKYDPNVTDNDMPVVLNADDQKTMMFGIINGIHKKKYFSDPKFVKLYNKSLRKKKLEELNFFNEKL
jgi:hypothetical protein